MGKKYTVFVSSTYDDLKEERREVINALRELNCIPCGMETFPADNDEQFEFIKDVIDECDYFVLIIAGRYGSVSSGGLSFTEMEYRYAVEKGIPVLVFIHSDRNSISIEKSESNPQRREKLEAFIKLASTDRMVKFWKGKEELTKKVSTSMISTVSRHPAKGWVRGSTFNDYKPITFANEKSDLCGKCVQLLDKMYNTAMYFKDQKEYEKARDFFECCLILAPEAEEPIREYGGLCYDNGQYQRALFYWEKLLGFRKLCRYYYLCAIACYCLNDIIRAKEFCQQALECPDDGCHHMVHELMQRENLK